MTISDRDWEMMTILRKLWTDEDGQDLTEYALLLVFLVLGAVAAMGNFAQALSQTFSSAAANINSQT